MLIESQESTPQGGAKESRVRRQMQPAFPDNPVLVRCWRGGRVESIHRGSWVLMDANGEVIDGQGAFDFPVYARSSTKALQALPLIESGAADAFEFSKKELALALASHRGEKIHTQVVGGLLSRLGMGTDDLRCGSQMPWESEVRHQLRVSGEQPSALHNNCSGKHASFLALAKHLGDDLQSYIDPASNGQKLVHQTMLEMTGVQPEELTTALDGCSAPTFRLPLKNLALAFARFANPGGLSSSRREACERLADAVGENPDLIGGSRNQICSAIARVTGGRLFPKFGAEAVYILGERGGDRALAIKMDDGQERWLHTVTLHLLRRFGLAKDQELSALSAWAAGPETNYAGLVVGRTEVVE
ncbi:MAG: L-asparaginase II [Candidatus Paceibacteria bacterium]|jgi:L-asparaginase II